MWKLYENFHIFSSETIRGNTVHTYIYLNKEKMLISLKLTFENVFQKLSHPITHCVGAAGGKICINEKAKKGFMCLLLFRAHYAIINKICRIKSNLRNFTFQRRCYDFKTGEFFNNVKQILSIVLIVDHLPTRFPL